MRLLLDSHVLIWLYEGDARLTAQARSALSNSGSQLIVSAATYWEMGLKQALGGLPLLDPLLNCLRAGSPFPGTETLPVAIRHVAAAVRLPRHHGDPFDRMLVGQAMVEGLTIMTHDRQFEPYGAPILWT